MKTYDVWVELDQEHTDPQVQGILDHFNREIRGLGVTGSLVHEAHPPFKMRLEVSHILSLAEVDAASEILCIAFLEAFPGSDPEVVKFILR